MIGELGVFPHNMAACSPLAVGGILFVTTANGVDEGHINIPAPQAPSFVAIDKNSGKVLWKRNDPGKNIMHGQWSNATYAEIKGVKQVIFPGGDGVLRGFKPETGDVLWEFDCNPKESKYELGGTGTRSDFIGTPVVSEGKVYIGVGQDPEHFSGVGHFWCIDPAKATKPGMDISPELGEWGQPGKPNPNSGLVWHYGGPDRRKYVPRDFVFGRTMSTATIVDGVVYIAELQGFVHCLDAKTGKKFWQYDLKGAIWGSTNYVDGKVYLATEGGDVFCFKHDKAPEVIDEVDIPDATDAKDFNQKLKAKRKQVEAKYLLGKAEFDAPVRSTPVVADGVMYVMTEKTLYALEPKK
jgi:outer membrane protein assembly factor BamB